MAHLVPPSRARHRRKTEKDEKDEKEKKSNPLREAVRKAICERCYDWLVRSNKAFMDKMNEQQGIQGKYFEAFTKQARLQRIGSRAYEERITEQALQQLEPVLRDLEYRLDYIKERLQNDRHQLRDDTVKAWAEVKNTWRPGMDVEFPDGDDEVVATAPSNPAIRISEPTEDTEVHIRPPAVPGATVPSTANLGTAAQRSATPSMRTTIPTTTQNFAGAVPYGSPADYAPPPVPNVPQFDNNDQRQRQMQTPNQAQNRTNIPATGGFRRERSREHHPVRGASRGGAIEPLSRSEFQRQRGFDGRR